MSKVHDLKTHPDPFSATWKRIKSFEFRRDDRGFEVGDVLRLKEWQPDPVGDAPSCETPGYYTGLEVLVLVTYMVRGPAFGVPAGFVVLSIRMLS